MGFKLAAITVLALVSVGIAVITGTIVSLRVRRIWRVISLPLPSLTVKVTVCVVP